LRGGEWPRKAARDLAAEGVLFRHGRRIHRNEMAEHHTGEVAGRMDVCVGCGGGLTERVETAIDDVAVTVGAGHRDTKLDVIGLSLRPGAGHRLCDAYRLGPSGRRRRGAHRQHGGGQNAAWSHDNPLPPLTRAQSNRPAGMSHSFVALTGEKVQNLRGRATAYQSCYAMKKHLMAGR